MQETKISLKENPEKIQEKEICDDKEEIKIEKKIMINCNDYHELKDSFNLINEDLINQVIKQKPFIAPEIIGKKIEELSLDKENSDQEDLKESIEQCKTIKFPSGIAQTAKRNKGGKVSYETDYSGLNSKVYEKFKKNITKELDILIGNAGITFNKSSIMDKIVTKKLSKNYFLLDRIYLWQYYIKTLDDTEKIKIVRNFLYRLKLFFKKCYEEFMNIDEINDAYKILRKSLSNKYEEKEWNEFFTLSKIFGYIDDKDLKDEFKSGKSISIKNRIKLNMKNEISGAGAGLIFINQLGNFSNMCLYSLIVFQMALGDCFELLKPDFEENYIKLHCVMFKYFDMFILSHSFIVKMFIQLLLIYSTYKQDGLIESLHKLLMAKFNGRGELEKLENSISKRIGDDIQYDEEKKIDNFQSIDELVNYIESGNNTKKKKKKKKNNDKNEIDELCKIYEGKNFGDDCDEDIYESIPDNISVMSGISEADSIVRAFKHDIKGLNFSGEKLKIDLSDSFIFNLNDN